MKRIAAVVVAVWCCGYVGTAAGQTPGGQAVEAARPRPYERWLDVQTLSLGVRYRLLADTDGDVSHSQLLANESLKVRFNLDQGARVAVHAGVFTGNTFTGSWNATGVGTGAGAYRVYLKQLFVAVKPMRAVEGQVGSLYIARGQSTEISTFDNDGYITGARVSFKRPAVTGLDEISVTSGYLGDAAEPSFARRSERLGEHNYLQVLATRPMGKRVKASADYTRLAGMTTWREAIKVDGVWPLDSLRLELYQRIQSGPSMGFGFTAEKKVHRAVVQAGMADIDRFYGGLNADRFKDGQRVFAGMTMPLPFAPELVPSVYVGQAIANGRRMANGTRLDVTLSYDVLAAMKRRQQ